MSGQDRHPRADLRVARSHGGERPNPGRKKGGHAGSRQGAQPSGALPGRDGHTVNRTGGPSPLRRLQPLKRMGKAEGPPESRYGNISRVVQNSPPQDERGSWTSLAGRG